MEESVTNSYLLESVVTVFQETGCKQPHTPFTLLRLLAPL